MNCLHCYAENPGDALFCESCGSQLEVTCPNCGVESRFGARFCRKCGQQLIEAAQASLVINGKFGSIETYTPKHLAERILASRHKLEGERKQVTVLFADIKGSTKLIENLDPEKGQKLIDPVLRIMKYVTRILSAAIIITIYLSVVHAEDGQDPGKGPNRYVVSNLTSDLPGMAQNTDAVLQNAWGVTFTPGASPFWIADNATGCSTLYDGKGAIASTLQVKLPLAGGSIPATACRHGACVRGRQLRAWPVAGRDQLGGLLDDPWSVARRKFPLGKPARISGTTWVPSKICIRFQTMSAIEKAIDPLYGAARSVLRAVRSF